MNVQQLKVSTVLVCAGFSVSLMNPANSRDDAFVKGPMLVTQLKLLTNKKTVAVTAFLRAQTDAAEIRLHKADLLSFRVSKPDVSHAEGRKK